jgi:hypothetical protein
VVDVENPDGFPLHLDWYPGATVARLNTDGHRWWLNETLVREWLEGLDVVFSVETLYDWRLADWARDAGVATVVQCNPEFFQHHNEGWHEPAPTVWWNPTTWRAGDIPAHVRHVPVPVALDRFDSRTNDGMKESFLHREPRRLRALHVIGRPALGDRNGTEVVQASMKLTRHVDWRLTAQRPTPRAPGAAPEVADYWRLYDDADVLVMPRRYGGLCLPAQEAMAAGLAVVMPSCPPNMDWPVVGCRWKFRGTIAVPTGTIPLVETDPHHLAEQLDRLALDPGSLATSQTGSRGWAADHSWDALLPLYERELGLAVDEMARSLTA